jgi:hypothetical protein
MPLSELVGMRLSGVCFVQDYIELHFSGPIVRILGHFTVGNTVDRYSVTTIGWRDKICQLIADEVQHITLVELSRFEIVFSSGISIDVSLIPDERTGPETLHFVPTGSGPIQVW